MGWSTQVNNELYHPDLPRLLLGLFVTLLLLTAFGAWAARRLGPRLVTVLFVVGWVAWTPFFARYSVPLYGFVIATTTVGGSLGAAFGVAYGLAPKGVPARGGWQGHGLVLARAFAVAALGVLLFPILLAMVVMSFGIDSI